MKKESPKNLILIIADGAREDVFQSLLNSGKLPHIKKHIVDRGSYKKSLSVFPTTTGPAHLPFLTGSHPGEANLPGYRWIDREAILKNKKTNKKFRSYNGTAGLFYHKDINPQTDSLYNYFKKPAIIFEPINYSPQKKLKSPQIGRVLHLLFAHYTKWWRPADRFVQRSMLKRIRQKHDCIVALFLGIDEYSHLNSPTHEKTIRSYITVDNAIKKAVALLKKQNLYDKTVFTIVSDHGHTATQHHISLVDLAKDSGFTPLFFPRIYPNNFDLAIMESGNSMAQLYFKVGPNWAQRAKIEWLNNDSKAVILLKKLINHPGIAFITMQTNKGIIIKDKSGEIEITLKDNNYAIEIKGENPLQNQLQEKTYSSEDLFELSYNDLYPDAINQICKLFKSSRSGDLFITSKPGYDLREKYEHPEHKSSHGSLHKDHMKVPMASSFKIEDNSLSNIKVFNEILQATGRKN